MQLFDGEIRDDRKSVGKIGPKNHNYGTGPSKATLDAASSVSMGVSLSRRRENRRSLPGEPLGGG